MRREWGTLPMANPSDEPGVRTISTDPSLFLLSNAAETPRAKHFSWMTVCRPAHQGYTVASRIATKSALPEQPEEIQFSCSPGLHFHLQGVV